MTHKEGNLESSTGDWRSQILPNYWNLRQQLEDKYNEDPSKRNGLREQSIGGDHFVMTLGLAMNRTRDGEAVVSVYQALESILDLPYSGEFSWGMRRFIRRAPPHLIAEFGNLIQKMAEVD